MLSSTIKPSCRPFTLIFTVLAYFFSNNNPFYHLLFVSLHATLESAKQVLNENHTLASSPTPPLPLSPPFALVNDFCNKSSHPKPKVCLATLMKIPSTKYATNLTQLVRIIVDQTYKWSLTLGFKFKQYLTVQPSNWSINLLMCVKVSDVIVNYWEDGFIGLDEFNHKYVTYGTLDHFWTQILYQVFDCTDELDFFTFEEEKRTQGYKLVKEFMGSICNELSNLLHLGSSLTDSAGISWMKLIELKPTPLEVAMYKIDPKRFREIGLP